MKNFDKMRFCNFGKYDLAINRKFYRNILLIILVGSLGITISGFFGRWMMWNEQVKIAERCGITIQQLMESSGGASVYWHYSFIGSTVTILAAYLVFVYILLGGCWAHNLRNKQGRINELTLPATNLEKYTWHLALTLGGGFVACLASLAICDVVNFVLSYCVFPHEGLFTSMIGQLILPFIDDKLLNVGPWTEIVYIAKKLIWLVAGAVFYAVSLYVLGNAIKYKWNIILTYIAEQIIRFVFGIIGISTFISIDMNRSLDRGEAYGLADALYYSAVAGFFLLGIVMIWYSYRLYTKAQITSRMNK